MNSVLPMPAQAASATPNVAGAPVAAPAGLQDTPAPTAHSGSGALRTDYCCGRPKTEPLLRFVPT
jgi:hypothetical protein